MGHLVDDPELLRSCCGITTTNDGDCARCCGGRDGFSHGLGTLGEDIELEDATGTIPDDCLRGGDDLGKEFAGLRTAVKDIQLN